MSAHSAVARAQVWSPDGKQIALSGAALRVVDTRAALMSLAASHATAPVPATPPPALPNPVHVLPNTGAVFAPAWSPDTRTLAYLADGQTLTFYDVAKQQAKSMNTPALSPIAWSRDSALYAMARKSEAGPLQALIQYRSGAQFLPPIDLPFASLPAAFNPFGWLANTTNVIVAGGDAGKYDLYLLDQGEVVRLTSTGDVLGFAVSADGTRLRWARRAPNTRYILLQLYEMNLDTRSLRKLPFPDTLPAVNPNPRNAPDSVEGVTFAPDLSRIAFVTRGGPQVGANGVALWVSDIAGQNARLVGKGTGANAVLNSPVPRSATQQTGYTFPAYPPAFAPDGKLLAVTRSENGKMSLLLADAATGQGKYLALP